MSMLLQVYSSLNGADGASSKLVQRFADEWLAHHPGGRVLTRDLAKQPIAHLSASAFQGFRLDPSERTAEQELVARLSDELIAELQSADTVAIGVPMYNFGIPSTLRSYFDHIARAGVTFKYTSAGHEGLLRDKRAVIFVTRGGRYATDQESQTSYLRQFLGFLGFKNIEFVYAEGLALGEASASQSLGAAQESLRSLAHQHHALAA
jgi:FMN-dependent NADH-azoreductase